MFYQLSSLFQLLNKIKHILMMRRRNNTEMKFIVLSSLLLGCLLVMTVKGTSARVVSGHEGNKNKLDVTGVTTQKEPFEGTGAAHMRKLGFGTTHHEGTSVDSKNGKGTDHHGEGTSIKISGKEKDGLKNPFGSLQAQKNDHQKHMIMGPKAYLKFTKFVIPRKSLTNTNTKCSQECDALQVKGGSLERSSRSEQPISEEPQGTATKDENQSLSDAAKEIESLIFKDYKGRPTHKPPINNHGPNN